MRLRLKSQAFFYILIALLYTNAFASKYNMPLGVTPLSHEIYNLHMLVFYICIAICMGVFVVMFYAVYKFRKSQGAVPTKMPGSLTVEIIWTVIPVIILVLMAIPTIKVMIKMKDSARPDINIKVTGYQWKWRYEYLDNGVNFFSNLATPADQISGKVAKAENYLLEVDKPLVVPIHKKIRFLFTSADVIHSWWVPDFGVKMDSIPGYITESWAVIERPGVYHGQCAELCGMRHGYMPIVVVAKTEKDYADWVLIQRGEKDKTTSPKTLDMETAMALGKQVYTANCSVCHQASGKGMPPAMPGLIGSKLTTGKLSEHIAIVLNGRQGSAMQAFAEQLTDAEIAAVVTYERNAWDNANTNKYGQLAGGLVQPDVVTAMREGQTHTKQEKEQVTQAKEQAVNTKEALTELGKINYQKHCAVCHREDGKGMPPAFPGLLGSKISVGPIDNHIEIVLNGKKGTAMQGFAGQLTDREVAAVVTYERNTWENDDKKKYGESAGGVVTPGQVKKVRQ